MDPAGLLGIFQGVATLAQAEPAILAARLALIAIGCGLVALGARHVLEPLLMIPMGLGMAAVNAGVLFLADGRTGTLFLDPLVAEPDALIGVLQVDWLQPVYTFAFSNGLIACLVFLGIGVLLDVGYLMARPFQSMFIALCAEMGTLATFPIAIAMGLTPKESAAVALIGGADGPMVLFGSLALAPHLFVPITVVGYLYLGLTYGAYPMLVRRLVPARLRGIDMSTDAIRPASRESKLAFAVIACVLLCLLFPAAAPLFLALFLGVAVRESGVEPFVKLLSETVLYGATFFLGLVLGVLCEARTLLDPTVLRLLVLGVVALTLSALGGLAAGWLLWWATGGRVNPVIGVAGVSCVPTTAKIAQQLVTEVRPGAVVLPHALGANVSGVITTAILCGIYIALLR
jgi:oxaloacetate decarboxylase beta subunit